MIDKTESCALCGVELADVYGFMGTDKKFCSDECAEAYFAAKRPLPCPHCAQPIDPKLIRKAANALAASAPRPGSAKNTRNPYGRKGKPKLAG